MEEKLIIAIVGGVFGAVLTALATIARELLAERRARKKDAQYLAIRLVCNLDAFLEGCVAVVADDGTHHGQVDRDGRHTIQAPLPTLNLDLGDVNWKSLPPKLMYRALYFPNLIKDANNYIDSVFEDVASPPDYRQGFEERQLQYSKLGVQALELSECLRVRYQVPKYNNTDWDVAYHMISKRDSLEKERKQRHAEYQATIAKMQVARDCNK